MMVLPFSQLPFTISAGLCALDANVEGDRGTPLPLMWMPLGRNIFEEFGAIKCAAVLVFRHTRICSGAFDS